MYDWTDGHKRGKMVGAGRKQAEDCGFFAFLFADTMPFFFNFVMAVSRWIIC